MFVGLHDFRTFMHKSIGEIDKVTRRTVTELNVTEARLCHFSDKYSYFLPGGMRKENFTYYDVHISASGFVRRQVRDHTIDTVSFQLHTQV